MCHHALIVAAKCDHARAIHLVIEKGTDFTPALTTVKRSGAKYLAVLFVAPQCGQIMQTARSIGIKSTLLGHAGCHPLSGQARPAGTPASSARP